MRGCLGAILITLAIVCIVVGIAFPPLLVAGLAQIVITPAILRFFFGKEKVNDYYNHKK